MFHTPHLAFRTWAQRKDRRNLYGPKAGEYRRPMNVPSVELPGLFGYGCPGYDRVHAKTDETEKEKENCPEPSQQYVGGANGTWGDRLVPIRGAVDGAI